MAAITTTAADWLERHERPAGARILAGGRPTPAQQEALQRDVVAAFPEYRLGVYFAERPGVLAGADHIVLARDDAGIGCGDGDGDGRLLGVLVARRKDGAAGAFLHVEMNLITADRQRSGLLVPLWRALLTRLLDEPGGFPALLALKTYNPMVYSLFSLVAARTGAGLYPPLPADPAAGDPGVAATSPLAGLARTVATEVSPRAPFDPVTGVLRGAGVPRDFYPSLPTTNRKAVQAYFARNVQPGDRLLCLLAFGDGAEVAPLLRRLGVRVDGPVRIAPTAPTYRTARGGPAHD